MFNAVVRSAVDCHSGRSRFVTLSEVEGLGGYVLNAFRPKWRNPRIVKQISPLRSKLTIPLLRLSLGFVLTRSAVSASLGMTSTSIIDCGPDDKYINNQLWTG
jgi:hypothetical protein